MTTENMTRLTGPDGIDLGDGLTARLLPDDPTTLALTQMVGDIAVTAATLEGIGAEDIDQTITQLTDAAMMIRPTDPELFPTDDEDAPEIILRPFDYLIPAGIGSGDSLRVTTESGSATVTVYSYSDHGWPMYGVANLLTEQALLLAVPAIGSVLNGYMGRTRFAGIGIDADADEGSSSIHITPFHLGMDRESWIALAVLMVRAAAVAGEVR